MLVKRSIFLDQSITEIDFNLVWTMESINSSRVRSLLTDGDLNKIFQCLSLTSGTSFTDFIGQ